MSYETISVRMNRSDPSIRWGFTLRQQGGKLLVASVSLFFSSQDYVTSHTCLPWTLTEQDNKLIVDDVRPGFGTGFGSAYGGTGNALSNHSTKQLDYRSSHDVSTNHHQSATNNYKSSSWDKTANERSLPIKYETGQHSDYSSANRTSHQGSYVVNNAQPRMYHSPSSYSRHEQSSYSKHTSSNGTQGNGHIPSYSTQTKTNLGVGNGSTLGVSGGASAGGYRSGVTPTYNTNFGAQRHTAASAVSPAAQSYRLSTNYRTQSPAYLTSEAKKASFVLIEEQEGRGVHRIASPSTQSSSFKRISQAVGEPVK
ncbi:unnamed protein product [Nippostrongylus brasiliensis]|uniref:Hornerin-like n=1 Tax=Nippostrongylus brasiliensis TaxID=27835 RepID=A0A158QYR1_NIPBR|nr:unnamed protein product [Nippostrongylus brasiliensis]